MAKEAGIPLAVFRLRQKAELGGASYEELRELVTRKSVNVARKRAQQPGATLSWGAAEVERDYAAAMGIDVADLFSRWDFERKALPGGPKGASKGSFGALNLRAGDPIRLEGPSPMTGAMSSWELYPGTTATVETAGSIQTTRGRNLGFSSRFGGEVIGAGAGS
jgi:hypothetical protein